MMGGLFGIIGILLVGYGLFFYKLGKVESAVKSFEKRLANLESHLLKKD